MQKKISTEQWLERSLEILNKQGFGRLNIDRLVKAMGVTKGSFYWHFTSRKDFVTRLVEYWDAIFTDTVIEHIEKFEGDGRQRLLELMLLITGKQLGQYDFTIHALAQNEEDVFPLVSKVLKKRIEFVAGLFAEMGFQGAEVELRSRATVMFMIQEQNSLIKDAKGKQLERIQLAHALFTGPNTEYVTSIQPVNEG